MQFRMNPPLLARIAHAIPRLPMETRVPYVMRTVRERVVLPCRLPSEVPLAPSFIQNPFRRHSLHSWLPPPPPLDRIVTSRLPKANETLITRRPPTCTTSSTLPIGRWPPGAAGPSIASSSSSNNNKNNFAADARTLAPRLRTSGTSDTSG
ncbi:hypothetical protein XA68_11794 [Ophiocordyceps unilateralis]|uniref:Uncharacterized protein n=1 Tax=Ophiocordyceps unilateralis TaxID=268505 RepID=A0A2A9PEB4_OPHUN|nr:hypothetical protein XA68_11794 [Ophiocordyceps unilateralis]